MSKMKQPLASAKHIPRSNANTRLVNNFLFQNWLTLPSYPFKGLMNTIIFVLYHTLESSML